MNVLRFLGNELKKWAIGFVAAAAVFGLCTWLMTLAPELDNQQETAAAAPVTKRTAKVVETGTGVTVMSAEDWASRYPEIYASYMANSENEEIHDYVEAYPMISTVYEGMAFSKFYGSARGHTYTVDDVTATGRPHKLANCFSCKTPNFTAMVNEMGDAAYRLEFEDVLTQVNEPISCYNCHANTGDELVVTHTYLSDAMGDDLQKVDPATLACAQLADVGDLSALRVGYAEFVYATKLQQLILGNPSQYYSNGNLQTLYLGKNKLLKKLKWTSQKLLHFS